MPNPVYPTRKIYLDGVDISGRVNSSIEGQSGISSYSDVERLSSAGFLRLVIDNSDGTYAGAFALAGKEVSVTLTLGTRVKQVFFGYILKARIDPGEWGDRKIEVHAVDWLHVAQNTRVQYLPLAEFTTADEAIQELATAPLNRPANYNLDIGAEEFTSMYDAAALKSSVFSEMDKVTKTDLGYLYLKFRDTLSGETLRFENENARTSTTPVKRVPSSVAAPSFLKYHGNAGASGYLKNSTGGFIKLGLANNSIFDRSMIEADWEVGENVINKFSVNQTPRKRDASVAVLYNLETAILFGSNQKFSLNGGYTDPDGRAPIQAYDVVTPVATTDYLFNAKADGTGTNLTANVDVLFSYGTNGWQVTFRNSKQPAYLTFFQVRGKGIYKHDPVETIVENLESQEDIVGMERSGSITREYSDDYTKSLRFASHVVAVNRTPRRVMKSASFVANTSEHLALAFMYLEQGDKIRIVESRPSHTGNYYIQGVRFTITPEGIIYFTWHLKEAIETICEPIAVYSPTNNSSSDNRVAIDYGILPQLANLPQFSYSLWVKRTSPTHGSFGPMIGRDIDTGSGRRGHFFFLYSDKFLFTSYKTPTDGAWETGSIITSVDVWEHVVLTYDNSTDTADPEVWLNGVSQSVSETGAPSGSTDDDADAPFRLFNIGPDPAIAGTLYYYSAIGHFALKDVRVYNRILTQAEITELANGEDDYSIVQDGLLFNGIYVPRDNRADYIDHSILESDLVIEAVHGDAGIPYNEFPPATDRQPTGDDNYLSGSELQP